MIICGRKWDDGGDLESLYVKSMMIDGTACYEFIGKPPLVYGCRLCHMPYTHWLCSDKIWQSLPPILHNKVLCQDCFVALRAYNKLIRIVNKKEKNYADN